MLKKQWREYASKARSVAKHIITGYEQSKDGTRLVKVVDKLDIYASSALNNKYADVGSKASVHTSAGGNQEIATEHADGSEGLFQTNGVIRPTNNVMDKDIEEYLNNLDENKQNTNMNKKLIRLTESQLHRIIKESINKVINESNDSTYDEKFSLDMHTLFNLMKDEIGKDSIRDDIASYFWLDWNGDTKIVPCKFNDNGMFFLAYDLCNYDLICLDDNGKVNVDYSNHTDIAKIIAPYLSQENGLRIVHNLYGR